MKKIVVLTLLLHCLTVSSGRNHDIKAMVDSLQHMQADTLNCSADLYWRIIAKGDKAIPFLIDKLNDTNSTNIKSPCKTTRLNVAEVSYAALDEISFLPIFLITRIQFDVIHNECWNFYDYFYNNKNKKEFQRMVRDWYSKEKNNYKPKTISKKKQTDCQRKYKITKYWDWKR